MAEQLDLNQLRDRIKKNQQLGESAPESGAVFITPEGTIQLGNSGTGQANSRGSRTGTKLPSTIFASSR